MKSVEKTTGLRYWMLRVLEECDRVAVSFGTDPVHDLRVSLRRCRSMADGMMAMDPDPDWKAMKKAGKRLFQSLGGLRDVQIMMEWLDKLQDGMRPQGNVGTPGQGGEGEEKLPKAVQQTGDTFDENSAKEKHEPQQAGDSDQVARVMLGILRQRETEQKRAARAALEEFDRKQWRQWSKTLPVRAAHMRPGSAVFKHLALERWMAARELHNRAMRNRSQVALHTLRIGIKRFRYIVENFLPAEHKAWSNDLKHMQDLLGEVHDLDVLWATALSCRVFQDAGSRRSWHARIADERKKRIDEYRRKMVGPNSLWDVWRSGLPEGKQVQQIATRRMKLWARALDPDFPHSERVARLALELYDGLHAVGLGAKTESLNGAGTEARSSLYVAALLHDVGKALGKKGHHKESLELIKSHGTPLGWSPEIMHRAAVIARFHDGALPVRSHKLLRHLLPEEQRTIIRLAAILRLANAFDATHDGRIRRVKIEPFVSPLRGSSSRTSGSRNGVNGFRRRTPVTPRNAALVIAAEGYTGGSATAQTVAGERYLLETVLRRPILIKPLRVQALA